MASHRVPLTDLGSAPLRPLLLGATGTLEKQILESSSPPYGSLQARAQRRRGGEIETSMMRENHRPAASCMPHTGDQAPNSGMCPARESNHELLVYRSTRNH